MLLVVVKNNIKIVLSEIDPQIRFLGFLLHHCHDVIDKYTHSVEISFILQVAIVVPAVSLCSNCKYYYDCSFIRWAFLNVFQISRLLSHEELVVVGGCVKACGCWNKVQGESEPKRESPGRRGVSFCTLINTTRYESDQHDLLATDSRLSL